MEEGAAERDSGLAEMFFFPSLFSFFFSFLTATAYSIVINDDSASWKFLRRRPVEQFP